MPVWNSNPAHFALALEHLLAQEFGDFELILADNGSSDPARALYADAARRDARIRLFRHEVNTGAIANFRFVLQQARGDLFMWAADDDERSPAWLRRCVEALDRRPECVAAGPLCVMIDDDGKRLWPAEVDTRHVGSSSAARRMLALRAAWPNMDVYGLHRRSVLDELDMSIQSIWIDRNILVDILLHGPIARVEEELFFYRLPRGRDETYERRAYQHFGESARPSGRANASASNWSGYDYAGSAFQQLSTALLSRARLTPRERGEAFVALAAVLSAQGWFTRDEVYAIVPELKRAVSERDLAASLQLGLRLLSVSPTFPLAVGMRKALRLLGRQR
jgi:glycosyltransferase involved in cell wall biosynthesis